MYNYANLHNFLRTLTLLTAVLISFMPGFVTPLYAQPETESDRCQTPAASHVDWYGCDKRNADLQGALLRRADLRNVDLRGADLRGAILYHATLVGADLRGADLRNAVLDGANLRFAKLDGAKLDGAMLAGTDLRSANGWPDVTTDTWASTLCPDHTSSERNGHSCHGHFVDSIALVAR